MTDHNLTPDQQAQLQAEPEPMASPQHRRWLKAQLNELYGLPPEAQRPTCWDTGFNWNQR